MYQSTDNDTKKASYIYIFASKKGRGRSSTSCVARDESS